MTLITQTKEHEHFWLHSNSTIDGHKVSKATKLRGRHTCSVTNKTIRLLFKNHLECTTRSQTTKDLPFILAKVKRNSQTTFVNGFCAEKILHARKVTYFAHVLTEGKQHHFYEMKHKPYFAPESIAKKTPQLDQFIKEKNIEEANRCVLELAAICLLPGLQKSTELASAMRVTGYLIGCGFENITRNSILGMELLKNALQFEPENLEFMVNFGHVLLVAGQLEEAKKLCMKVCKERPDYSFAVQILGDVFVRCKAGSEAVDFLQKLINPFIPTAHIKAAMAEQYVAGGEGLPRDLKKAEDGRCAEFRVPGSAHAGSGPGGRG